MFKIFSGDPLPQGPIKHKKLFTQNCLCFVCEFYLNNQELICTFVKFYSLSVLLFLGFGGPLCLYAIELVLSSKT